jgi:subtilisin family serine protease
VLRVTTETGRNPLKIANDIARRGGVASCRPQRFIPLNRVDEGVSNASALPDGRTHVLFDCQWHLGHDSIARECDIIAREFGSIANESIAPFAGINARGAWKHTTGSPDIVVAVIDDGFDLGHPAFQNKKIDEHQINFAEGPRAKASSRGNDIHGTCVASIAIGSTVAGGMVGVAPDCAFLPIRVDLSGLLEEKKLADIFDHASKHADVVNCSFSVSPSTSNLIEGPLLDAIKEMAGSGGRRNRGLVFVFGAGNDDAPTRMSAEENTQGIWIVRHSSTKPRLLGPGENIVSGFTTIPGVVVVGAVTSLKRKAGYSNWGPDITVVAPSDNSHDILNKVKPGVNDKVRNKFKPRFGYPGLGLIAAANRPGNGLPFHRLPDDSETEEFLESFYTGRFGGTSGAAAIVTGVVALMLSVNPSLTPEEVIDILKETADRDLDPTLDLKDDPNLKGTTGEFNGSRRSEFFGSGKVNAALAVKTALDRR